MWGTMPFPREEDICPSGRSTRGRLGQPETATSAYFAFRRPVNCGPDEGRNEHVVKQVIGADDVVPVRASEPTNQILSSA